MGIAGAAIATDISQVISAVLCMLYLMRVNESYKVSLKKIRIHKEVAIRIIQVGVPTAIRIPLFRLQTYWFSPVSTATVLWRWQDLQRTSRSTDSTSCRL